MTAVSWHSAMSDDLSVMSRGHGEVEAKHPADSILRLIGADPAYM